MKKMNFSYHNICLNLCTICNLKCSWCYNQTDKKNFLSLNDFSDFYTFIIKQNIDKVVLIGGEPTVHPDFISILNILADKQIYLTSNGLMFSNKEFLNNCIKTQKFLDGKMVGLKSISISLKGYDEASFFSTTKTNKFKYLCHAIENLNKCNIPISYSYIFNSHIPTGEQKNFLLFLKHYQISKIIISEPRPYFNGDKIIHTKTIDNLKDFLYYLESNDITTYFQPSHPLCHYDSELIDYLRNRSKIISNCAVKKCSGYFFSSLLELIPCNELYKINLAKYKVNFNNFHELEQLWHSQYIQNFYNKLAGYPQAKCAKCEMWNICGGNCILHWIKGE